MNNETIPQAVGTSSITTSSRTGYISSDSFYIPEKKLEIKNMDYGYLLNIDGKEVCVSSNRQVFMIVNHYVSGLTAKDIIQILFEDVV